MFSSQSTGGIGQRLLNQYQRNNDLVSRSLERLSTGKRINRAKDDPAGYIAAESLRGDIVELKAESRASQGDRLLTRQRQSALGAIQNQLIEVRGNLVYAADGTLTASQREAIQQEVDASLDAIDLVASRTSGVGDSSSLAPLRSDGESNVIDGDIEAGAELVDGKIRSIGQYRASLAGYERNQITLFDNLRKDQIAILSQALSEIEDADFAVETSNLIQGQILSQASILAFGFLNREFIEQMKELLGTVEVDAI